jgi:hypothetical protein
VCGLTFRCRSVCTGISHSNSSYSITEDTILCLGPFRNNIKGIQVLVTSANSDIIFYFLGLHPVACNITTLNKVPPFATKLCVFSLLFYTAPALHVSAYKQAIVRCFLTNYKKVKLLRFYSVEPLSRDIVL